MRKMYFILMAALLLFNRSVYGQEKKRFGVGFTINRFQNDFGLGVHAVSPYFAGNAVAVKLGGNFHWFQHIDNQRTVWTLYYNIQLGCRGRLPVIDKKLFVYGEGGPVLLLPGSRLSSRQTIFGGYGLFGFEFMATERLGYLIELGGMGTGARADKVPSEPIFSNGFTASTGLRFRI